MAPGAGGGQRLRPGARSRPVPSRSDPMSPVRARAKPSPAPPVVPTFVYMTLRPLDTSEGAREAQRAALARLGPEGRVRAALEMSDSLRRVRLAGLRASHPDASEPELVELFVAEAHGVMLSAAE